MSRIEWYLNMQRKYPCRVAKDLQCAEGYAVTRGGGLYWVKNAHSVWVFDVTRIIQRNNRIVCDGLTLMDILRAERAAQLIQEIHVDLLGARRS